MDTSPLASIPPEIRHQIYELAFYQSQPIQISWCICRTSPPNTLTSDCGPADLLALTATCKLIREESTQLFYATNTFVMKCKRDDNKTHMLRRFLSNIGEANTKALGSVIVDIGGLISQLQPLNPSDAVDDKLREALKQFHHGVPIGMPHDLPLTLRAQWVLRGSVTKPMQLDMRSLEKDLAYAEEEFKFLIAEDRGGLSRALLELYQIRVQLLDCAADYAVEAYKNALEAR